MLEDEKVTAARVSSSRVRRSLLRALSCLQERLGRYTHLPAKGLVLCGGVTDNDEKLVLVDVEPFVPVRALSYKCGSKFHTGILDEMMDGCGRVGFIVMDYGGFLFGTISAGRRSVLHKAWVDIHHGMGTTGRLMLLRRALTRKCILKVAETAAWLFITTGGKLNVSSVVLAGVPTFTNGLIRSEAFDERLAAIVVKVVDVPSGGETGFDKAINLAAEELVAVEVEQEDKVRLLLHNLQQGLPACRSETGANLNKTEN
jgi:peptide subunit release factor 1 (eRF1)